MDSDVAHGRDRSISCREDSWIQIDRDLLAELREQGMTTLLVDRMAGLALSVADRAYLLQSGIVRHTGSASDLRADPALVRTYLGEHERAT
jgi:branched-chain amino acid transport system ATP-binding protein